MKRLLIAIALLPLAGCGGGTPDYNQVEVRPEEARAEAAIDRAAKDQGVATVATKGVPVASPTPRGVATLPVGFGGYWGRTPGDCELANVDARGRIVIEGESIRFFEGRARLSDVVVASPYRLAATMTTGDGDTRRSAPVTLLLEEGNTRLVQRSGASTLTYKRC